ncbi:MAG: hypothetical protein ABIK28_19635 [Planctomycetota bacterium]
MPRISLKGLANFMTSGAARQRKILRDYKYPDPEGAAQAGYYRDARNCILEYHREGREEAWLYERHRHLRGQSIVAPPQVKPRLENNARAVRQYARNFSGRNFTILENVPLALAFSGVTVSVYPDLHVNERNREKIIKLDFSKQPTNDQAIRIMSQAMFEAQVQAGMGLTSASVLYLDVPRSQEYRGARAGSRMLREIEAACENITAIWDGI